MQCTFADGCLLTGRPSDDRPTCPPPITAERARQNVPSASSYMPLKHSRTCRSSGSNEQETGSTSMQSIGQASGQRVLNDEARTENAPRKKVRLVFFVRTSHEVTYTVSQRNCATFIFTAILANIGRF